MNLQDIEMMIFNCPHTDSIHCDARIRCHPIPGCGSANPEFLLLGINPGRRGEVWCKYDSPEELKQHYLIECINLKYPYGKLLKKLENLIPQFRIPETVYLTDIVKCPTRKGNPPKNMVEKCVSTYLEKTVQVLNPKFIICLGMQPRIFVGDTFRNKAASSRLVVVAVPHPNRTQIENVATAIAKKVKEPEAVVSVKFRKKFFVSPHSLKKSRMRNVVEEKLLNLGYRKIREKKWIKRKWAVHVIHSSEFGKYYIRIMWREEWKDDHAIIYDYSSAGGPVCVVPVSDLFISDFVKEKRKSNAYANSGFWWSQRFPADHKLAKLVLSFEGRWDLL